MPCCGRPDLKNKKEGAAGYYQKYAYLSGAQQEAAEKVIGKISKCVTCDALTYTDNNNCMVCNNPKEEQS